MNNMTPGEKRSLTSSIKKSYETFLLEGQSFQTKNDLLNSFYTFWINNSIENKLSWCFDKKNGLKGYHTSITFKEEATSKIEETLQSELSNFAFEEKFIQLGSLKDVSKKIKNIRSKKKRIRKKFEKKMLVI